MNEMFEIFARTGIACKVLFWFACFSKTHLCPASNVPVDVEEIRNQKLENHYKKYLNNSQFCYSHQFYLYSKKRLKLKSADVERMARGLRGDDRHIV